MRQVYLSTPPSIARDFNFRQAKKGISELKNITAVQSRMRIAKNYNFCSIANRRAVPTELTRTNLLDSATGFPGDSKDRSSILFGHRLDKYIQVLQIVGVLVVLIVVLDECVYFPLKSLFTCSSCSLFIFSFCFHEIRSLIRWSLSTFFIELEYPTFLNTISFSSCCNVGVIFQCKFVILKNLFSCPPNF